jgi:hypothetical protein
MKNLIEGHLYELENFENKTEEGQKLQFIQKEPTGTNCGTLTTISDGTTNEDVLAMLIDRMKYLQAKFPCRENAMVITKLEESLMWLEKRTSDRIKRNVEGKQIV